ncbi:MAG TPA: lactoylglutathione lyase [Solibacterales bacterium]|nr:lactoylglutathione lyase [Bryobacterales bacterium]
MKILLLAAIGTLAAFGQSPDYRDEGIGKIVQIAIVCKDLDACSARWSRLLGQPAPPPRTTLPGREVNVKYRGKDSGGQVKLTFFKTGDAVLELMQPVGPGTHWKEHLDQFGEGVHHIAFRVKNLDKTIAALEAEGMPVVHRGRFDSKNGDYVYVDSKAKLGVTIELLHWDDPAKN